MIITLYKGCILTNNYQEVFDTKIREGKTTSVFEDYLDTLQKADYDVNGYVTDNGSFNIKYSFAGLSPFECNYVKFTDGSRVVYAFVDRVERSNNLVTVYYTCDVFHTYFPQCNIRRLISNTLRHPIGEYKQIMSYESNDYPNITSHSTVNECYIICKLQTYTLTNGGGRSNVVNKLVLIANGDKDDTIITNKIVGFTLNRMSIITELIEKNSRGDTPNLTEDKLSTGGSNVSTLFQIAEYYILPYDLSNIVDYFDIDKTMADYWALWSLKEASGLPYDYVLMFELKESYNIGSFVNLNEIEFNNDFTRIGVGFFTSIIPVDNNGSNIKVSLAAAMTNIDLLIYIQVQGRIIDISEQFIYDIPYENVSSEVSATREISRKLSVYKGALSITSGTMKQISENLNARATITQGETVAGYNQRVALGTNWISGTAENLGQIANGLIDIWAANAQKFMSFYGINVNNKSIINVIFNLIDVKITPDNDEQVRAFNNELGYECVRVSNDLTFGNELSVIGNYDVISLADMIITGVPNNIIDEIKNIFNKPVKVWYTTNVS